MSEELTIDVLGLRIAVRATGPKDAPPIVALHGWLDNAATFDRLAPLLPDHRVLAIDLPGHGLSQHRSADASYDLINGAADLFHICAALALPERFVVMGHSMGAAIAALFAGSFGERVSKLVLLEGLGPLADPPAEAPKRLRNALLDEKRGSKTRVFADINEAASRVLQAMPMSEESVRILLRRGLVPVPGGLTWRSDPRLRASSRLRMSEDQVAAYMRSVTCPTLVVLAEHGWPISPEAVDVRTGYLPNKDIVRVPGSHHVHLDAPESFAPPLLRFLHSI